MFSQVPVGLSTGGGRERYVLSRGMVHPALVLLRGYILSWSCPGEGRGTLIRLAVVGIAS